MERLALIGVSHRRGGLAAIETWQGGPNHVERLAEIGVPEWVPIATCNRWDVVLALPAGLELERVRLQLTPAGANVRPYAYLGDGALEQLTRIAASLDSLNPGEDQIMAQVREAFRTAQASGTTGPVTSFAFHTALRIAKRVRRDLELAPLNTSLFSLARPALEAVLPPGGRVAVLGAGTMGTLAAKSLAELPGAKLLVVSRRAAQAAALAEVVGAEPLSLEAFLANPPADLRALVCALAAPGVVGLELLKRLPKLALIVDVGLPRNVQPGTAERAGIAALDVDTLQAAGRARRAAIAEKLAAAERLIQDEVAAAQDAWTERQLGPSIQHLRDLYLKTLGGSLPQEDAERLAHKFAHVPVKGLRALARAYGLDAARLFLAEAGLAE